MNLCGKYRDIVEQLAKTGAGHGIPRPPAVRLTADPFKILAITLLVGFGWSAFSPAGSQQAFPDQPTQAQNDAMRARLSYLDTIHDVSWWTLYGYSVHIGVKGPAEANLDILNGAVGNMIGALGGTHQVKGFLYGAANFPSAMASTERATCKSQGTTHVEQTRCRH